MKFSTIWFSNHYINYFWEIEFIVNINIGILVLCVPHQRQATTEWLHFYVLRWNNNCPILISCSKQSIFLKNLHLILFLQPYHKKKGADFTCCYSEVSPNTYNHTTRKAHTLWREHSLSCRDGYIPLIGDFQNTSSRSKHFFSNMTC